MQVDKLAGLPQPVEELAEVFLHDALRKVARRWVAEPHPLSIEAQRMGGGDQTLRRIAALEVTSRDGLRSAVKYPKKREYTICSS
jgi:hypothetical protein